MNNPVPAGFDSLPVLDLRDPNFTVEGNRLLAELRAKGPVCRVEPLGALGFLRWADCDAILRDFKTFSAAFERSPPVPGAEEETKIDTLLREDPPKHTRVRALMQQAFTPERVAAMEPHTRDITRKLIDDIMAGGNECDFLHQFALPLPSTVMSGLLGVDASMMETFARWASSMMGANTAHAIKDEAARQKRYEELARDAKDMEAFLLERMEERRKSPQQDLITYLIQAAEGGDRLTEREALTLMKLCVIAGNDLTTQALALTLDCLLENPEQMRLLANDLSLAANAFEESLRFNGPVVSPATQGASGRRDRRGEGARGLPGRPGGQLGQPRRSGLRQSGSFRHPPQDPAGSQHEQRESPVHRPAARPSRGPRRVRGVVRQRLVLRAQGPASTDQADGPPGVRSVAGGPGTAAGESRGDGAGRQRRQAGGDGRETRRHVRPATGAGQAPDHDA